MKLPLVLCKETLDLQHILPTTYRFVAVEGLYGFNEVDYRQEKLVGQDAMGNEVWQAIDSTEDSLFIKALGQHLLKRINE